MLALTHKYSVGRQAGQPVVKCPARAIIIATFFFKPNDHADRSKQRSATNVVAWRCTHMTTTTMWCVYVCLFTIHFFWVSVWSEWKGRGSEGGEFDYDTKKKETNKKIFQSRFSPSASATPLPQTTTRKGYDEGIHHHHRHRHHRARAHTKQAVKNS